MSRESHFALRERWRSVHFSGGSTSSPFGVLKSGLLDLRGIRFENSACGIVLREADLTNADFSKCSLNEFRLERCFLGRVDFACGREIGCTFEACEFEACNFQRTCIGYNGSQYRQCIFSKCNLTRCSGINALFEDCIFDTCVFKDTRFGPSGFWRCRFSGTVADAWFAGDHNIPAKRELFGKPCRPGLHMIDLSEAEVGCLTLSDNCPVEDVKLPVDAIWYDMRRLHSSSRRIVQGFNSTEQSAVTGILKILVTQRDTQPSAIVGRLFLNKHLGADIAGRLFVAISHEARYVG